MAYKVFSNGEALTGSELNTYLMNQSVMVFASTTARDAALTAPTEGMVVWLQDADKYVYYATGAWRDLISSTGSGNAVINGAFDIWQRGTSFSNPASLAYTADRWFVLHNGTGATRTISKQTFIPGAAPVIGYEGESFYRYALSAAGSGNTSNQISTKLEDVRLFAGQTITISFWARADASRTIELNIAQNFGSGGSTLVARSGGTHAVTTSWQRFTAQIDMPVLTGKTIGAGSNIQPWLELGNSPATFTFELWGFQIEAGSSATPFKRNASNIQGELAACQRYYWRYTAEAAFATFGNGWCDTTTLAYAYVTHPVTMRSIPTVTGSAANTFRYVASTIAQALTSIGFSATSRGLRADATSTGYTAGRGGELQANNTTSAYIEASAEL